MKKKIYFSGSIAGGRDDVKLYKKIIDMMKKTDEVLTEHIGNVNYSIKNRKEKDNQKIYEQDTNWLKECDLVIAECSHPSLGVGYEMAYAEKIGKPVYIFYRKDIYLSVMLSGDPYFICYSYESEEDLFNKIKHILENT